MGHGWNIICIVAAIGTVDQYRNPTVRSIRSIVFIT